MDGVLLPLFAEINWAIGYFVPVFWAQAAMLVLSAALQPVARSEAGSGARETIGSAVALAAVLLWPLLPLTSWHPIDGAEVIAIAPDPTALATLAILALVKRGAKAVVLAIAPLAWCLVSCFTLLTMGAWRGWLVGVAAGAGCIALALPQRWER